MSENWRKEQDSLGHVKVPKSALWGAQTQRSLENFRIGEQRFPLSFIRALALVKQAAALGNHQLDKLDKQRTELICCVCEEILQGQHDDQFPLSVWQTGSGTQTNMNLNEVIANRGNELAGKPRGEYTPLHPNDHVNLSQSSNDVFPTAMHVCCAQRMTNALLPALTGLVNSLGVKQQEFADCIKSGRTHMMDATPVTLGQEFAAFQAQLEYARTQLEAVMPNVLALAIGGSAVGTGLNTHPQWAQQVCRQIADLSGLDFRPTGNHFMALAAHDALLDLQARLTGLASALFKMASDIRLMNSGPRCGLAEIRVPANEPGSSIMPGKVNPTQVEALTMVCVQVMGNATAVNMAGSQGQFQLNVFKPLILMRVLESIELLADAMSSFDQHCLQELQANREQLQYYVQRSLMLVTALTPHIGYAKAAEVAHYADQHDCSLREAALALQVMTAEAFDAAVDPAAMLEPRR
ncbi:MAG: class II fumarate hydratase [Pseudomonadales bacterium]|nr:class II fumarate hydratase [Pseudomonadales bacterium]